MIAITAHEGSMPNPSATSLVARYFLDLARQGKGCATNNETIARTLRITTKAVSSAKQALVKSGRLKGNWQVFHSIDGVRFGEVQASDVDEVKALLRRRYAPVYDVRTEVDPERVANGTPALVFVGTRTVTWDEAVRMAKEIATIAGGKW